MSLIHLFSGVVTKDTCVECGQLVMIPPGVYYGEGTDQPMHSGCAELRSRIDFSENVTAPACDEIESELEDFFSDMEEDE